MDVFSVILIVIWVLIIFEGIYGVVKGYFRREQEKSKKHDPVAYRKWVRLCSIFCIICGVLNVIWSIMDGFTDAKDFKYIICIIVTVAAVIAAAAVSYARIVKPADKAKGIESEFDRTLKDDKNK